MIAFQIEDVTTKLIPVPYFDEPLGVAEPEGSFYNEAKIEPCGFRSVTNCDSWVENDSPSRIRKSNAKRQSGMWAA